MPAAGTASAVFRYRVANTVSCLEQAPFTVDFSGNAGDYVARDSSVLVRLQADNGTPVADALDTFETTTLWTLTGEWQISRPRGKGGAGTVDGNGGPDPAAAFGGIRVLGVDLIGAGASLGNYENNLGSAITATSPSYDCTNSHNVHVQFKRWLGVEGSQFDHATVQAWDGANWQVVWANPSDDLSDLSWQSVDYDVSQYADGNPAFKVRFTMSSNGAKVFCGWNIDDLRITNGYTPQVCETGTCPIGCASVTEISGVGIDQDRLDLDPDLESERRRLSLALGNGLPRLPGDERRPAHRDAGSLARRLVLRGRDGARRRREPGERVLHGNPGARGGAGLLLPRRGRRHQRRRGPEGLAGDVGGRPSRPPHPVPIENRPQGAAASTGRRRRPPAAEPPSGRHWAPSRRCRRESRTAEAPPGTAVRSRAPTPTTHLSGTGGPLRVH